MNGLNLRKNETNIEINKEMVRWLYYYVCFTGYTYNL